MAKIIKMEVDKPKRVPLHKNRNHIDMIKEDIVRKHNEKLKK